MPEARKSLRHFSFIVHRSSLIVNYFIIYFVTKPEKSLIKKRFNSSGDTRTL